MCILQMLVVTATPEALLGFWQADKGEGHSDMKREGEKESKRQERERKGED